MKTPFRALTEYALVFRLACREGQMKAKAEIAQKLRAMFSEATLRDNPLAMQFVACCKEMLEVEQLAMISDNPMILSSIKDWQREFDAINVKVYLIACRSPDSYVFAPDDNRLSFRMERLRVPS